MHILMLTQYFPPEIGASQARLEYYAKYFHKKGNRVTVVTTFPNYPKGKIFGGYRNRLFYRETFDGIDVVRTWLWEDSDISSKARIKWFISFMLSALFAGLRIDKPEIILVENPPLFVGITANVLRRLINAPVVNHLSDMWVDAAVNFGFLKKGWQLNLARRMERYVLQNCDAIISVTDNVHKHALRFQPESKVRLIPNGVDTDMFIKKPPDLGLRKKLGVEGKFLVTYAGTMGYQHGLDAIVNAAEMLQKTNDAYRFLFIGEGSEKERIRQLVIKKRIDNILFIEAQPQRTLVDYLNISDCGISTLKKANFTEGVRPVKLYTYMACSLPIVATNIGESGVLMDQASCGITVPPEDPCAIVEALNRLYTDSLTRLELGKRGRIFVEKHFSRQEAASQLLNFMDNIVKGRSAEQ